MGVSSWKSLAVKKGRAVCAWGSTATSVEDKLHLKDLFQLRGSAGQQAHHSPIAYRRGGRRLVLSVSKERIEESFY